MKFLFRAFFAAMLMFSVSTQAQTLKFGHINSADLLQLMPEVKVADSAIAKYQTDLENLNAKMLKEYDDKLKEMQGDPKMSDAEKELKSQELSDLESRIQNFQSTAQDKLTDKKQTLYKPILDKAEKAIKDVAKEKGYSYVFDTSVGAVIYAQDSDDIMNLVKAKLGLK